MVPKLSFPDYLGRDMQARQYLTFDGAGGVVYLDIYNVNRLNLSSMTGATTVDRVRESYLAAVFGSFQVPSELKSEWEFLPIKGSRDIYKG